MSIEKIIDVYNNLDDLQGTGTVLREGLKSVSSVQNLCDWKIETKQKASLFFRFVLPGIIYILAVKGMEELVEPISDVLFVTSGLPEYTEPIWGLIIVSPTVKELFLIFSVNKDILCLAFCSTNC